MQIDRFVDADSVDPIFYEKSYHLGPDKGGDQTFTLLARALSETGKVGIGKVVLRTKEYLASVRPSGDGLVLSTMHFSDEVVEPENLEGAPEDGIELRDRELAIANQLVDSLSADFEHGKYEDSYRDQVMALIQAKADGKEIDLTRPEEPEATDDLLAALEASLRRRGGRRGWQANEIARERGDGSARVLTDRACRNPSSRAGRRRASPASR